MFNKIITLLMVITLGFFLTGESLGMIPLLQQKDDLEMSLTLEKTAYLQSTEENLVPISLQIRIEVVNRGNQKFLLDASSFDISHLWASKNAQDDLERRFEISNSISVLSARQKDYQEVSLNDLTVLNPGSKLVQSREVVVLLNRKAGEKIAGSLFGGEHIIRVQSNDLPWNQNEIEFIAKKFSANGVFVVRPIISRPLKICLR